MTKSMHARAAGVKLDPRSVTLIRTLLDLEERLSAYSSEVGSLCYTPHSWSLPCKVLLRS